MRDFVLGIYGLVMFYILLNRIMPIDLQVGDVFSTLVSLGGFFFTILTSSPLIALLAAMVIVGAVILKLR